VLQSTYIRTVRVGGGRRRGCFSRQFYHYAGVLQCKPLLLLNIITDYLLIYRQNRLVFLYFEQVKEKRNICAPMLNSKACLYNGSKKYTSKETTPTRLTPIN